LTRTQLGPDLDQLPLPAVFALAVIQVRVYDAIVVEGLKRSQGQPEPA